jgi:hypothetical protein
MKHNTGLLLLICAFCVSLTNAVEYLQSGVTWAVHKDVSLNITKYFWEGFRDNLYETVFCEDGCHFNHGEDTILTAVSSNVTIYNMTFDTVNFTNTDNIIVLIESSQTIKIVIEKLLFSVKYNFISESPIYSDIGNGSYSNEMTVTLAVQPNNCNTTGKFQAKFNSIVVQINDLDNHPIKIEAKTIPSIRLSAMFERWRKFALDRINDMLSLFKQDIEDGFNNRFAELIYTSTDDPHTPCNLTEPSNLRLCPVATPIRHFSNPLLRNFTQTSVCVCENLIDYETKTLNPSIREDFISTRLYAMTFAPNRSESLVNLVDSENLKYMPTFESDKTGYKIQSFASEDFINSFTRSFSIDGKLDIPLHKNTTVLLGQA